MVTAIHSGSSGGKGGIRITSRGIMEHKVINNLRMVNGDKFLFRELHQKFIIALGQVEDSHDEIIQHLVKETHFGKELDKFVAELRATYEAEVARVSGDVCNILLDKAEDEAYDKIKMFHKKGTHCRWSSVSLVH